MSTGRSKHPLHKRRLYTGTSPGGQYQNQIDYILCSQKWRSSIQSTETRPGADCGSDPELVIVKFRLKLKKVGKTTRPFRYDLNQIPYYYIVEVRNRFKGFRSDRQSAWRTIDRGSWHSIGGSDQDHPQEKEMQKDKMVAKPYKLLRKEKTQKAKNRKDISIWMQSSK